MEAKNLTDYCHDDVAGALAALPAHIENAQANPGAALTPTQKQNFLANFLKIAQYLLANLPAILTAVSAAAAPTGTGTTASPATSAPTKAMNPRS
jgi:hypothetical protein